MPATTISALAPSVTIRLLRMFSQRLPVAKARA